MKISKGIAILTGVICLLIYISRLVIARLVFREASAVGIIGELYGPTAAFITEELIPRFMIFTASVFSLLSWMFLHFEGKK